MSLLFYEGTKFWSSPSEYKPGSKLTDKHIAQIEESLSVKLPNEYIDLMKQQNGGTLTYGYIPFEDGDVVWIPYFQELELEAGVGLSPIFLEESALPANMVLIAGDFDTWLVLDYRNNEEPAVVYWQQIVTDTGDSSWQEYHIATSFAELLTKIFMK
ncbi:SMI1/KNR4 family protein [Bacillus solitudinis]|uniref:SMI1/KNR4 family protein n=1 Tax=Bacillus solitudinis TaxID=2014074 RepID=UPI000C24F223|nr:SMI1/KNR4 family protein [Bacillus solitudinis]